MHKVRKFSLLAAIAAIAAPAAAVQFVVTYPSVTAIQSNNDFMAELDAQSPSLDFFAASGATLSLTGKGVVTFEYMGSESGFTDHFKAGSVTGTETNKSVWGPTLLGSATFDAGAITKWKFTSDKGLAAKIGQQGFGIFVPDKSGTYKNSVLFFGYDDQINNPDDNHDDFIVRATVQGVPEPATWAMLIAGFGMVGYAARRKEQRMGLRRVNA